MKSLMPCTKWALVTQPPFIETAEEAWLPHRQVVAFKKKSSVNSFKLLGESMSSLSAIFFDLDGTLVDSSIGITMGSYAWPTWSP